MRLLFCIFCIILIYNVSFGQYQDIQQFIAKGKNFDQIYSKAKNSIAKLEKSKKKKKLKPEEIIEEDGDYQRLERWAWYWRDRLNEDRTLMNPMDQLKLYKTYKNSTQYLRNNPTWKHEGPTRNTGGYWAMGRTTHIDFHPTNRNIFFVAAANGGLWKTIDAGLNYTSLGEDLPQQPVGIVIVDPRNANTIYITIGEKAGWWQYGLGVYKSIDGGQTWKTTGLSYKLNENRVIYGLAMNPNNSNILIASCNNGIFRTTDGGNNWSKVRTEDFSDIKFKPNDGNIVFAARNDYWGSCEVFKSTDGGINWTQISNFNIQKNFMRLQVTPANPNLVAINASEDGKPKLYLSKDEGIKFEYLSNLPENTIFYISPTQEDVMYCGYVKVHKSYDGGFSWQEITSWWNDGKNPEVHADHHFVAFDPKAKNELYFCNDGGLHRYDENLEDWQELSQNLPITQFYKMAISTTNPPALVGGSQDNGGFIRRSNGTWGNTNGGDAMWQLIDPNDAKIMYSEYWGGRAVYRSNNSWIDAVDIQPNVTGQQMQGQWVTPFNLNPKNTKTFIIGYEDIYVSYNRGATFNKISNNLTGATDKDLKTVDINPLDTNIIFATYANIIYYSYNFGKSWSKSTLSSSNEITSVEFHPTDTNRCWLTRGGVGTFKVQESKDKGKTWKTITSNFPATPALVIRYDPASNALFVGTDIGLFYSDADNISWQYYGKGLPNTSVTDIEFHQLTRKMYVSTFGRGFYSIDLPTCYPSAITIQSKVNNLTFTIKDTLFACIGDQITLKSNIDSLKGTYIWKGPQKLDTIINNNNTLPILNLNSINKSGYYTLQFISDKSCTRLDSMYIKVNSIPISEIISDVSELDCNHTKITLRNSVIANEIKYSWLKDGRNLKDSSAIEITLPGKYTLTSNQPNGNCKSTDTIEIVKINPPKAKYEIKNIDCFGDKTGSVDILITEGSAPYKIQYPDSSFISNPKQLIAGKYIIKISDSRNCQSIDTIHILQNAEINAQFTIKNSANNDGEIDIELSGGIKPYTLELYKDGNIIGTSHPFKDLTDGFYQVKILDSIGCIKIIDSIEVKRITSISNINASFIKIYPNPASHFLNMESKEINLSQCKFEIFDRAGRIQNPQIKQNNSNKASLMLDQINQGIYLLRISSNEFKQEYKFEIIK